MVRKVTFCNSCQIQYFELGIFTFNSYVQYLTHGFIASTRAFNCATRVFSFLTRAYELVTCGFKLVTRGFKLVTRGFKLVARVLLFHNVSIATTSQFYYNEPLTLCRACLAHFTR